LPILILFPHNRCNCRCVMCDIWKTDSAREISAADLERHMTDIEGLGVEWIVFSGGEPLMHSDLFRLADLVRAHGLRTTVLSTGLLLGRYAEQVVRSIDDVIVSLDGPREVHDKIRRVPGAFDQLAQGVRALHSRRSDYPVSARSTVQRENAGKLRETVEAARELGMKSISFLAADSRAGVFNRLEARPSLVPEFEELEGEIEALIEQESGGGFVVETPEKLRRIVRHFRKEAGSPRCNAPWVSAVVETDGTVRPCFFHDPIGDLSRQSLTQVVNGPRAVEFRKNLNVAENPVCRQCVCSLYRA
jgi:MoaA/NifB/PqqE/SkfB family radical SAM enzyme